MAIWPGKVCECGHDKDSHADEHDEVPTGSGHCEHPTCNFQRYKREAQRAEYEAEVRHGSFCHADLYLAECKGRDNERKRCRKLITDYLKFDHQTPIFGWHDVQDLLKRIDEIIPVNYQPKEANP